MPRRFQFSLRALLVALTTICLCLGMCVERARLRGRAIDAIIATGAMAYYEGGGDTFLGDPTTDRKYVGHFWADIRRLPLVIEMPGDVDLDAGIGRYLEQAAPFQTIGFNFPVRDDALQHLNGINDGCEVVFYHDENLSTAALSTLRQRMPNVVF